MFCMSVPSASLPMQLVLVILVESDSEVTTTDACDPEGRVLGFLGYRRNLNCSVM